MRADFSPTALAARRLAASQPPFPLPPERPAESRWCEWPRRAAAPAPRAGIWQTLRQIQARHA